ncbi:MAG: bifunctional nicotinamidase/pyrazinamidase [Spirochaetes bacterium]|jgi:nicotinamidase/pyrazinamidase|nr:bifunctional nicotinamidase/pyrazinamidase [Spirochaetota bacterium]
MNDFAITPTTALLVIDVQNDFCPGGNLAVEEGDSVIPVINGIAARFPLVVATRDWHPQGHVSFASSHPEKEVQDTVRVNGIEQILWPEHCVQGTAGAAFHPDLDLRPINLVLHKGTKKGLDSYSAFYENDKNTETGMRSYLEGLGFDRVVVCGLAADVCVYFTAVDARAIGLETAVVWDATRGVDIPAGSVDEARRDMEQRGAAIVESGDLTS